MGQTESSQASFVGVLPTASPVHTRLAHTASQTRSSTSISPTPVPVIAAPPHALSEQPNASETTRFLIPESVRKSQTMKEYTHECSEILPNFLYVSNLTVAQNESQLQQYNITHIINCCGEVTLNSLGELNSSSPRINMQLSLRDGVQEDILPFMYQVIHFIEQCRQSNGRVLIHCHQGVSRSCTFAIAYIMYRERLHGLSFHTALAFTKEKRPICSPNTAFLCQLIEWERELTTFKPFTAPQMLFTDLYRLSPHASYDASTFVLKVCYESSTTRQKIHFTSNCLWSAGLFVYMNENYEIVIWKGAKCTIENAVALAQEHIKCMLEVRFMNYPNRPHLNIVVIQDAAESVGVEQDHFGYEAELAWSCGTPDTHTTSDVTPMNSTESFMDSVLKPELYLLEDQSTPTWERLSNYDSDDLLPDNVFLLVSHDRSYIWFGTDSSVSEAEAMTAGVKQLQLLNAVTENLTFQHQGQETETFWQLFEEGY